jgi:uncharacterized membrane protein
VAKDARMSQSHARRTPAANEHMSLERVLLFGDAVMAIAITLLAVELRVPEHFGEGGGFALAMDALRPQFIAFVFSFLIIGETWIDHHRICRQLHAVDRGMPWWNLALLFFIVLMPFASGLLATHDANAVVFYAVVYGGMGLAKVGLWRHMVRRKLVPVPLDLEGRSTSFRLWAPPSASLVVALVAARGHEQALWGFLSLPPIMLLLHLLSRWTDRRRRIV